MVMLLTSAARARLLPAERLQPMPLPSRIVSNGEFTPPPQSRALRHYEARLLDRAQSLSRKIGVSADHLLRQPIGMSLAFESLNASFGPHFSLSQGEADDPTAANSVRAALADQFIFDDQVHFLKEEARPEDFLSLTGLIELSAELLNLPSKGNFSLEQIQFSQFLTDIYLTSDTKLALLSGAPSDGNPLLSNDQLAAARTAVNQLCGSRRLLCHAILTPGHPGWLAEMDRVHEHLKPDGWKGYTVGEPFSPSHHRYRLDDEALIYPAYARMEQAGVRNFAIHKGLLPENAESVMPGAEPFARVDDLAKAACDWPQINFIIYHCAYRTIPQPTQIEVERFEATGRIDWVSDLAEIPARYGVQNVFADIAAAFAFTVLTHPRMAAGMIGILLNGLGADHVLWGTDSVWYGSPQWQIEALRRLKMPTDLQDRFGFPDLGDADGPIKAAILGRNAARLYGVDPLEYKARGVQAGHVEAIAARYKELGGGPANRAYGYVHGGQADA
jgi:uncharacterized protein